MGVHEARPDGVLEHRFDFDLPSQGRPQQLHRVENQLVDVDIARLQRLLAGEGQQPLGQRCAALGGFIDHLGDRRRLRLVGNGFREHLDGASDDGQNVIEVMGDPSGQLPHRLHLLGLPNLRFRRNPLRQIANEGVEHVAAAPA